jgi:hypothetical protein
MIVSSLITTIRNTFMHCQEIERLKRDRNATMNYRQRCLKKGKETLAYKMQKKVDYITETIYQMQSTAGG